jgi:hypothetical protein
MKVSDLTPSRKLSIENPRSDSSQILYDQYQMDTWIARNGDVEVIYDEYYKCYRVPAFAETREEYSKIKQIDCMKWGCE